jgi:8-oxo-dGTP diphosphatase
VWRGPDRLLLVRRGQPPRAGEWSIPGGRVELGESVRDALLREILEETGLVIRVAELIDVAEIIERDAEGEIATHFVLIDFSAHWVEGESFAASDAAECCWGAPRTALDQVSWDETRRIIRASAQDLWNLRL